MNVTAACNHILLQLSHLVKNISDDDFTKPSEALGRNTIGQHVRHTLEFFVCFHHGHQQGTVNYDKRGHDKTIETQREKALETIRFVMDFVTSLNTNQPLKLEVGYDLIEDKFIVIDTNVLRELVYNIEHAVHHMAIIKIGIREVAPYLSLPSDFGVAASTVRHRQQQLHSVS